MGIRFLAVTQPLLANWPDIFMGILFGDSLKNLIFGGKNERDCNNGAKWSGS